MRLAFAGILLAVAFAQSPATSPNTVERKELLSNRRVVVTRAELAPHAASQMHRHDRDFVEVFLTPAKERITIPGEKPPVEKNDLGEVRFRSKGLTHAVQNVGDAPVRTVMVELTDAQGKMERSGKASRYCNPGSKTECVEEKTLFCTERICVEDVTIAAGGVTTKHSHATDHMLVAVSDYELTDQAEGNADAVRRRASGEVEYIKAGITHQLTNTGKAAARFIVIVWR